MLEIATGFQGLAELVDFLYSHPSETAGQRLWYEERYPAVKAELAELRASPAVSGFVDRYSSILASQILDFMEEGDLAAAAEVRVDLLEELLYQAKHYSQPVQVVEPRVYQTSAGAANQPLAMAA